MKKILLFSFFICLSFLCQSQSKYDIEGIWLEEEGQSKIKIFSLETEKYGTMFGGRIIWLAEPFTEEGEIKRDTKNPDPKLKNQKILGSIIMKSLTYESKKGHWSGGSIYDARNGKTYSVEITMKDNNTLNLRGYLGVSLIGRTTTWTRVK